MGIGIGGFFDGIVFHQILQWHGMLTNRIPPDTLVNKSVNMFWDGIFHLFTLIAVIIGFISMTRLLRKKNIDPSPKLVIGGFFGGWGLFNLVEGLIHHHLLKLHNVKEFALNVAAWNYGFLASGLIMILLGYFIIKTKSYSSKRLENF
jgi:uncharacterized membrane protein